ncbi:TRAP transporter small permease [Brevibacterium luteolum]|nr:TRAP transporter small permease [Brevibacterium luteolum]
MLAEVVLRYLFSAPLGWNVSAVDRVLMPASVFLALPWLYVTSGHVTAEIVYDRLPSSVQRAARWLAFLVVFVSAAFLLFAGLRIAVGSMILGDSPPPGSGEIDIPTWTWQMIQPVGALGLIIVMTLDAPRFIRGESEGSNRDNGRVTS